MGVQEFVALLPLLILSSGIVSLLLQVAFFRSHRAALATTLLVLGLAISSCFILVVKLPKQGFTATGLFLIDHYSLFFCFLILFIGLFVSILGFHYLRARLGNKVTTIDGSNSYPEEFYILLLLSILGGCSLVFSSHFASFFLSLELMSLSLYPLLAFSVHGDRAPLVDQLLSLESGLKYLLMSALTTALGLFGIALVFAASGTLEFTILAAKSAQFSSSPLMIGGLSLLLMAMAFKLSLVPFHIWTADVYQGAPTAVTALIATLSKTAVAALLLRLFIQIDLFSMPVLTAMLALMAVASMLVGNLLALMQSNVKRLLAYSSIAHMGYLLVAFLVGGTAIGREAVAAYLVAYIITTLGAFTVVSLVADSTMPYASGNKNLATDIASDPFNQDFYRGLFWRSPWLVICFSVMLLSLAGIPLTIGFIGKFYIFVAGIEGQAWLLLAAVIVGSAIGLYYYLRLLLVMVQRNEKEIAPHLMLNSNGSLQISISGRSMLLILTAALLLFGVFPQFFINWLIVL